MTGFGAMHRDGSEMAEVSMTKGSSRSVGGGDGDGDGEMDVEMDGGMEVDNESLP